MQAGELVGGRFAIERSAGRGGMGEVFFARDQKTGKAAAVKLLTDKGERARERFAQEIYLLATIAHPSIVHYLDHGQTAVGEPYLAMEWLEGEDLSARLTRGPLPILESAALCSQVAQGLSVVHQKGVVHRDIKPSNLFLLQPSVHSEQPTIDSPPLTENASESGMWTVDARLDSLQLAQESTHQRWEEDGTAQAPTINHPTVSRGSTVKILDFGIARPDWLLRESQKPESPLGTPGYMAPEQARGDHNLDSRADLFSLGCVLYECLTGKPPFYAHHVVAILAKILFEEAPKVGALRPEVPAVLEDLVAALLSKDPLRRPESAEEVAVALEKISLMEPCELAPRSEGASLTGGEQRFLCVVLAGGVFSPSKTATQELTLGGRTALVPNFTPASTRGGAPEEPQATEPIPQSAEAQRLISLREVVEQYGGRSEPLADGAVAVLLLGGGAATDQAERAAHCALALRQLLPEAPMALAIGRGEVARLQVGEVIDRAARLLRLASQADALLSPGELRPIRVDEGAVGLLDLRFEIGGDATGLVLHAVRGAFAATRTLLGRPTPCVGRERELARLFEILHNCETTPKARAALVLAPAGVGKSRLRYEFVQELERRCRSFTLLLSRSDPLRVGSPFGMLSQALRHTARHLDGEPLALRQAKLRARLSRHIPKSNDVQRIAEFLGELVGVPFPDNNSVALRAARQDPRLMGDQMQRAFTDWLNQESAVHPVVFVLEDLHWGDLPSVRFLDAALFALRHRPFLVLALARPEVYELFPNLWRGRSLEEIPLSGLTKEASARLVRSVLGEDLSEGVVATLVERAEGNAFYLEELIRAVSNAGEGAQEQAALILPETVLGMVQARIASLPSGARRVLRAASVFGGSFWRGGVRALLGGEVELTEGLMELSDREMIFQRPERRFPGEEELAFRHSLLREAAYTTLLDTDRSLGHRLAAEWLLGAGEREAAVLAEHFERGGAPERAIEHYYRAAEQALEGNDLEAVLSRTERAIYCGAKGEALGELRLLQAISHNWRGEFSETLARALSALEHLPQGSAAWYSAAGEAAISSAKIGDHERLTALGEELVAMQAGTVTHPQLIAFARTATQLYLAGRYSPAEALREWIEANVRSVPSDPTVTARINEMRSFQLAIIHGDIAATIACNEDAAASFEISGDLRNAAANYSDTGFAYLEVGAYLKAEQVMERVLGMANEMGAHRLISVAKLVLGAALGRQGRFSEARTIELEAAEALTAQGDKRMAGFSRHQLARLLALSGDLASAEREAMLAVEMLAAIRPFLAPAMATLAEIQLNVGRATEAMETAQAAMELLDSLGQIGLNDSLVRLVYAELLFETGQREAAYQAIQAARDRLLMRAAKLSNQRVRKSFLEEAWENARTLALANAWLA